MVRIFALSMASVTSASQSGVSLHAASRPATVSKAIRKKVHIISAVAKDGTENVLAEMYKHIEKARADRKAALPVIQDVVYDDE